MTGQARQAALLRPAPIAIHNDRNMVRGIRPHALFRRHLIPHLRFTIHSYE
jgi:hypothetical protein